MNISLDETLPSGTTMGSITVDAPGGTLTAPVAGGTGTVTSTFPGPFNPGDEVVFTLIVNVKPATPGGTVITNSATASSPSDPTIANNTGTTTTNGGGGGTDDGGDEPGRLRAPAPGGGRVDGAPEGQRGGRVTTVASR